MPGTPLELVVTSNPDDDAALFQTYSRCMAQQAKKPESPGSIDKRPAVYPSVFMLSGSVLPNRYSPKNATLVRAGVIDPAEGFGQSLHIHAAGR